MISTFFGIFLMFGLHSWSVHHSVALPEPESEASSLFPVELGLLERVWIIKVSSTRSPVD